MVQRAAITLAQIADRQNLVQATWKAARGKRHRPEVAAFLNHLDERLETLAQGILCERVPSGGVRSFVIHDPKRRVITAVCFADRVLHHAVMNLAEPRFERMLVDGCYACRPGKGVHAAIAAVQRNLRRWPWFVQVDVDGYFPAIDHGLLKLLLARRFKDPGLLALLGRIIDLGAAGPRGLPIGALTSQHFANAFLDAGDRMLLARADVRAEVRYMDDIVWWCDSCAQAEASLAAFDTFLRTERRLRLKPGVQIGRSAAGLTFCGARVRTGVVLASSRKLSRYRAGLGRANAALDDGGVTAAAAQRAHDGLLAALTGTQTIGFRRRLASRPGDTAERED